MFDLCCFKGIEPRYKKLKEIKQDKVKEVGK
jgi:hypothetical protein